MIKPEQMTAYDDAAKVLRAAATMLNKINLARINPADRERIAKPIAGLQTLGAQLFSEAHDAFLVARGLNEPMCGCDLTATDGNHVRTCPTRRDPPMTPTRSEQLYAVTLWFSALNARTHRIDHRAKVIVSATSEDAAKERAWEVLKAKHADREPMLRTSEQLAPTVESIGDAAIVESSLGVL